MSEEKEEPKKAAEQTKPIEGGKAPEELKKFKEEFRKAADENVTMLERVESSMVELKGYMQKLDEGRLLIDSTEVKINRLAGILNRDISRPPPAGN